jgi:hypothetical protein
MTTPVSAGSYAASQVGDPSDTTDTSEAGTAPAGFGSFDDLSQFGVPPALANIPVPWGVGQDASAAAKTPTTTLKTGVLGTVFQGVNLPTSSAGQPQQIVTGGKVYDTQSYDQAIRAIYSPDLTASDLASLQNAMAAGGFMGKNPYFIPGQPDTKYTIPTWINIVKQAMRQGISPQDILQQGVDAQGGLEAGLAKFAPNTTGSVANINLTHPDDIRMVAKQTSMKVLGQGWNSQQLDQFVKTYQAMQVQDQSVPSGTGAVTTNAPSLQAAAEEEARRSNPVAAGATDWDNAAQQMLRVFQMLGNTGKTPQDFGQPGQQ